jgi:hypothetical protein
MSKCITIPCAKFCAAFALTAGSFVFGCSMLATGGVTVSMAPFYCSLITSAVAFWARPPSYTEEKKQDQQEPEERPLIN